VIVVPEQPETSASPTTTRDTEKAFNMSQQS
jgi:hypothetical protein